MEERLLGQVLVVKNAPDCDGLGHAEHMMGVPDEDAHARAAVEAEIRAGRTVPPIVLRRISRKDAQAYVREHHRHHPAFVGDRWRIAAWVDGKIVGIAIVGRPISREHDEEKIVEVTRLATDGHPNACSRLYGAAARGADALLFERITTITLAREPGSSVRAAGFVWATPDLRPTDRREDAFMPARDWHCKARPKERMGDLWGNPDPRSAVEQEPKIRWVRILSAGRRA